MFRKLCWQSNKPDEDDSCQNESNLNIKASLIVLDSIRRWSVILTFDRMGAAMLCHFKRKATTAVTEEIIEPKLPLSSCFTSCSPLSVSLQGRHIYREQTERKHPLKGFSMLFHYKHRPAILLMSISKPWHQWMTEKQLGQWPWMHYCLKQ